MRAIVLTSPEVTVTTANTVNLGTLIRVVATATATLTVRNSSAAIIGSCTVIGNSFPLFIDKNSTDTIESSGTLLCSSVNFCH